jgi:hypothetical protein
VSQLLNDTLERAERYARQLRQQKVELESVTSARDTLLTQLEAAEARERVLREAAEAFIEARQRWEEVPGVSARVPGEALDRLRAALAASPGEAVAKLLADERERISIEACSRLCERCELNIPVEFTGKEWRHLHGGWSVLCYASPIRSAIRALPATPATKSEGV